MKWRHGGSWKPNGETCRASGVITDEQIVEACKREARTIDELFMVRGMRERLSTRDARAVVALMVTALDAPPETWPEPDRCAKSEPNVDAQLDLMTAIVRLRAKESGGGDPDPCKP